MIPVQNMSTTNVATSVIVGDENTLVSKRMNLAHRNETNQVQEMEMMTLSLRQDKCQEENIHENANNKNNVIQSKLFILNII